MAKPHSTSQSAVNMLKKSRLLRTLPETVLQNLSPFFTVKRYPKQAELKPKDTSIAEIFFLIRGEIAIYSNGSPVCKLRRLGDMFGDMSFVTDKSFSTQEIAETPVELLSLKLSDLIEQKKIASDDVKWALYQLFTTMLVDKLTMCCSEAAKQHATASKLFSLKELLVETREQLKESNQVKQDFLSNISHEIRTPMHGVLGMTSLLLNTELSPHQKELAQTIQISATAFLDVINKILDFSKLKSGELEFQDRLFDVRKVLTNVVKELEPKSKEKNLPTTIRASQAVPKLVKGDAVRIHQILINLVGNAIKFTETGEVTLKVDVISRHENLIRLKFVVQDTGIGISEEDKHLLFKSFSQVDTSLTRKYGGTGLGLVISKQLIEAMNGETGFESREGEGSTFWFTLDLETRQDRRKYAGPDFPQNRKPTRHSDRVFLLQPQEKRTIEILLVCQDKIDQLVVILMLEKLGYSASVTNSGQEAMAHLEQNHIDLIIHDIKSQDSTQFDAIRKIRSANSGSFPRNVPVIALISHVLDGNRIRCLRAGMNDYLAKPVSLEDLDTVLQRWLSVRQNKTDDQQTPGNGPVRGVDMNTIIRLQNDLGDIDRLVALFLKELPIKMTLIRRSISANDSAELEKSAHTLKSNCITFGAWMMADSCYKLEKIGAQGTIDGSRELIDLLEAQAREVTAYFRDHFQIDSCKPSS